MRIVTAPSAAPGPVETTAPRPVLRNHDAEIASLREYRRTGDRAIVDDLVRAYAPMVRKAALRYRREGIEQDDLEQIGMMGLLRAISTFDPDRGVKLSTYAFHYITGEIRHYLRDDTGLVRVPRRLQALRSESARLHLKMAASFGRLPTASEVARDLGVSARELQEATSTGSVRPLSEIRNDDDRVAILADKMDGLGVEDRGLVRQAIRTLPPVQRRVVFYLFYQDLSQGEAARLLGVSQKHVSRLMKAALRGLTAPLAAAGFVPVSGTPVS